MQAAYLGRLLHPLRSDRGARECSKLVADWPDSFGLLLFHWLRLRVSLHHLLKSQLFDGRGWKEQLHSFVPDLLTLEEEGLTAASTGIYVVIEVSLISVSALCDKAKRHVLGVLKQAKMLEILLASVFSMVYDV